MATPNVWLWLAFAYKVLQMLKSLLGDDDNEESKKVIENKVV